MYICHPHIGFLPLFLHNISCEKKDIFILFWIWRFYNSESISISFIWTIKWMNQLTTYCEVGSFLHSVHVGDSQLCNDRKVFNTVGELPVCLHFN